MPIKPLGYAECTPVHQKRLNFPYNSFQLCLDFSGTANYLAKLKKKMGTLLAAAPCPYPSAFLAQSPHFLFSDLELEALVVDKERESRKQERGLQRVLPLPLGERRTLDVDEACEINVKGIMALLLAQQ